MISLLSYVLQYSRLGISFKIVLEVNKYDINDINDINDNWLYYEWNKKEEWINKNLNT